MLKFRYYIYILATYSLLASLVSFYVLCVAKNAGSCRVGCSDTFARLAHCCPLLSDCCSLANLGSTSTAQSSSPRLAPCAESTFCVRWVKRNFLSLSLSAADHVPVGPSESLAKVGMLIQKLTFEDGLLIGGDDLYIGECLTVVEVEGEASALPKELMVHFVIGSLAQKTQVLCPSSFCQLPSTSLCSIASIQLSPSPVHFFAFAWSLSSRL